MSRLKRVLEQIRGNYQRRKDGKFNAVPFIIKKLNKVVPGIIPGIHYLITAGTKIGKSKFVRRVFVLEPYYWAKSHNYDLEIFYFPLEDSADKVVKTLICGLMLKNFKIEMTVEMLDSVQEDCFLNENLLEKIASCEPELQVLLKDIHIADTVTDPENLYALIYHELIKPENGEIEYSVVTNAQGEEVRIPMRYKKNRERHFMVVIDNLNNLTTSQKYSTQRAAIDIWTEFYVRHLLCNFFGCSVVDVQQQAPANESAQYSNNGTLIWEKLMPSIAGLGDNKSTAQTAHIVMGLFSPYRHNIQSYEGMRYNVVKMKDFYRHLRVIASNIGESPVDIGVFFDGLTEMFHEMPGQDEKDKLEDMYGYVRGLEMKRGLSGSASSDLFAPFENLI